MQLGTRWTSGEQPPAAVPTLLHAQIAAVDAATLSDEPDQPRPRWTLTFLEGRPIAELDTGVIVEAGSDGTVVVRHDDEDDLG
ncbi:hypothetical protein [Microbacterium sp.]|uniref:hypothetical protein n=1 Tax=Microbacterium sp. TaxID=51671 RepID=UPI0025CB8599|nr:hypothetical protein [Microbacterium sp.]